MSYIEVKSSEVKIGDEFWCPLTKRWLPVEVVSQRMGVCIGDYQVRRKIQNGYYADGTQPETEWACNRCMYAWDGNGGWCPSCGQEATHGKAFECQEPKP